jgi:tetratricopeptide (TPR) repeat protein
MKHSDRSRLIGAGIGGRGRGSIVLVGLLLLLATACTDPPTDSGTTAAEELSEGWVDFEASRFSQAAGHFQSAVNKDGSLADAHNGLGWSRAMQENLSGAATSLQNALDRGLTTPDADAGLAVVFRDTPNYSQAISHAQAVITASPTYVFSHRTSIDHRDMHLVIAQSYYRLGESSFALAQAQVDILDPTNGLDPLDSGTWIVNSIVYATYAEALLKKIEELETTIGG